MKRVIPLMLTAFSALIVKAVELSGGVEFECASAYVYNGVVYNDEPVASYWPWLELHLTDDFWLYGNFWQIYDLTDRRREEGLRGEWNETDFEFGIGGVPWKSDDGECQLNAQLGWYWVTEVVENRWSNSFNYPQLGLVLENPWITPFVNLGYEFVNVHSLMVTLGLVKGFPITDNVSLEAMMLAYGGHARMMQITFLSENVDTGIGAVEGRLTLKWRVSDWLQLSCYCAFLGNVNGTIQDDWSDYGDDMPDYYTHSQMVFGGLTASFEF